MTAGYLRFLLVCLCLISVSQQKGDQTMNNTIATTLLCGPAAIPPEYEKPVCSLAARYVTGFSLSGLYKMDFDITYNRACNLVLNHLANNPAFSLDTFEDFINTRTLFYGVNDIQKVIAEYKRDPDAAFPYVLCFSAGSCAALRRTRLPTPKDWPRKRWIPFW